MNYYVIRPDLTPYEGIKVTKETNIKFSNQKVKQTIKNLKLHSEYTVVTNEFTSKNILDINLKEGDILLLEDENRGYFLPKDVAIAPISEAINDYQMLALALDGDSNDIKRDENKDI